MDSNEKGPVARVVSLVVSRLAYTFGRLAARIAARTQLLQRPMLGVYTVLLLGIAVVIGVTCLSWLSSHSSERLAVIGNLLSFGTLLLALVAGIVALAAYSAATGLPDLRLRALVRGAGAKSNLIVVTPTEVPPVTAAGNNELIVILVNRNVYAARSPAVIVRIESGNFRKEIFSAGEDWHITGRDMDRNIIAVQWDGGADYIIHGKSYRQIPDLHLEGLGGDSARITFRILADGYSRKEISLPVRFNSDSTPKRPSEANEGRTLL